MKICFYTLLVLFILPISTVSAEQEGQVEEEVLSGKELLAGCEEGAAPGAPNQYCMQYIFGLVQTVDTLQQAEPGPKVFCINPHKVSLQEVTETTTNWLKNVPDRLGEDAYKLVTESLHVSYPCELQNI
ncbi:MAG: hypothetical protein HW411_738 [Gammaproteobacteria bacterium]|nr:hypothetical protein [Gammaproteobacteria bacterium]